MRKVLFLFACLLALVGSGVAQVKGPDYKSLEKDLSKSNEAILNEKKAAKPKTWLARAELLQKISTSYQGNAYPGMDMKTFNLLCGPAVEQREEQVDGAAYQVMVMPRADFYFFDGVYAYYKVTKPLVDKPLDKALEAYRKALELEPKEKNRVKIGKSLAELEKLYVQEGASYYAQKSYEAAHGDFAQAVAICEMPEVSVVDTTLYYYKGLANFQTGNYAGATTDFAVAIAKGYSNNGEEYCVFYEAATKAGQMDEAKRMLEVGIEKFPLQQCIVLDMINYYISRDEDPKMVLPYLDRAIAGDSASAPLYFVKGVVYDKLGDRDQALAAYRKAVEVDPKYVDAYYNIAALYYNWGAELQNKAVDLPASEQNKYDALMEQASEKFHNCIPPAEEAIKVAPDHRESLDLLKQLYFRYRAEEGMQAKYDAVKAKLDALGAGN